MKKLIIILLFSLTANLSAQVDSINWLTDYKEAIKSSKTLNQPILVYITHERSSDADNALQKEVFNSEDFNKFQLSFVLLKLDLSKDTYHKRLALHYTKSEAIPALVLIDDNGNTIDKALTDINANSISEFMNILQKNTKY